MLTIAIANQKGGSGKTTTAVNLAACLAQRRKQVLLIDCDPQAQTSTSFGIDAPPIERSTFALFLYKEFLGVPLTHLAVPVADHLMLLPAAPLSLEKERELTSFPRYVWRLQEALAEIDSHGQARGPRAARVARGNLPSEHGEREGEAPVALPLEGATRAPVMEGRFDFVLLDCPPSLGVLTHAALFASQIALLPIETSFLALHGVGGLLRLIQSIDPQRSSPLHLLAVATLFDQRTNFARAVLKDMRNYFQERLLSTVIRHSVILREASSFGKPITTYAPRSRAQADYAALAEEVLERTLALTEGNSAGVPMDDVALFAHLYADGKRTADRLRSLGIDQLSALQSSDPEALSRVIKIPLGMAKRLIEKAARLHSLPLVVANQGIVIAPPAAPPSNALEGGGEVTSTELMALTVPHNLTDNSHEAM